MSPPLNIIDSHVHLWSLKDEWVSWPTDDLDIIYRDFELKDFSATTHNTTVSGLVLVQSQADVRDTVGLLSLAQKNELIKGVVGWADFTSPDAVAMIDYLAQSKKLVGLRPMLQNMDQRDFILDPVCAASLKRMEEKGLVFDALIRPDQLSQMAVLARLYPDLRIIIDHCAKPMIKKGVKPDGFWSDHMALLSEYDHINVKISGLLTECVDGAASDEVIAHMEVLYKIFGPEKLIWGSDWPVLLLSAPYKNWLDIALKWLLAKPDAAKEDIFYKNAVKTYRL